MSYYSPAGGDYKTYGYAGDPGFLSSLWKGVKKVASFIPGPIGMVATALGGAAAIQSSMKPSPGILPMAGGASMPGGSFPGAGSTAFARARGQTPMSNVARLNAAPYGTPMPGGACPTGYHLAKDGSGRMVRNRRMNIANPRALRRAMRRVQGFEKLAKRTITFTRRTKIKKRAP